PRTVNQHPGVLRRTARRPVASRPLTQPNATTPQLACSLLIAPAVTAAMYMTAIRAVPGLGCCHSANRVAWLHRGLRKVPGRDPEATDATGPAMYVEARARECAVRLPAGRGRYDSGSP